MNLQAFLTGSQVYGAPNLESDIDLVIPCEPSLEIWLRKHSDDETGKAIRFGRLNLVCAVNEAEYRAWKDGTESLCEDYRDHYEPIGRTAAKARFDRFRDEYGVQDRAQSSQDKA